MAITSFKPAAMLAFTIMIVLVALGQGEDAKPAVGPSLAQGSVKLHNVGAWSKEDGDTFAQLTDEFDNQQTIADDQPPTQGRNLAQITSKFVGAKLPSEEGDQFADLMDEFDEHQTIANDQPPTYGSTLAQITSKFVGAKLSTDTMGQQMTDFASLDDAFDENTWQVGQEPEAFSVRAWITNPKLYLAIALVLLGGLVATSPSSSPQQQPQQTTPPLAQRRESAATAAMARQQQQTSPTRLPTAQKLQVPETDDIDATPHLVENAERDIVSPNETACDSLMQAADACRAGQPGSYAEFCRVLTESAQSH